MPGIGAGCQETQKGDLRIGTKGERREGLEVEPVTMASVSVGQACMMGPP